MLQQGLYRLGKTAARLYTKTRLDMNVTWHAPLPAGPKIIAANHPTSSDPIWLLSLFPEQLRFIITYSLGQIPAARWYLNHAGHLIQDQTGRHSAFDRAVQCLKEGHNVAIFPEGRLTPRDANITCGVRTGAVRMALATGAPIIPVGISILSENITLQMHNFGDHQKQARWYLNGPYAITVGAPIQLEGSQDRERVIALSTALAQHILDLSQAGTSRLNVSGGYAAQSCAL